MKISTLFMALLLGLTAMTACQNDAPQTAEPTTEKATQPNTTLQGEAAEAPMPQPQPGTMAQPSNTMPGNTQPQVVPQSQVPVTIVAPPTGAVAAGMNPAHGQPNHRCDIAVGAPLNSKPVPKPQ